jgi:hypothetical protein
MQNIGKIDSCVVQPISHSRHMAISLTSLGKELKNNFAYFLSNRIQLQPLACKIMSFFHRNESSGSSWYRSVLRLPD